MPVEPLPHDPVPRDSWEHHLADLLDDFGAQADSAFDRERAFEVADQARAEYGSVSLASRLMAAVDSDVVVRVAGVGALSGRLTRCTASWFLLTATGREWLVMMTAVVTADGVPALAVPEAAWPFTARLGPASALRRLAEAGRPATLHLAAGDRLDGRWGRIGQDFVEVLQGDRRRPTLVAHAAIAAVTHPL